MGQAFRRAAGRLRSTSIDTSSAPSRHQNSFDRTKPSVTGDDTLHVYKKDPGGEGTSKSNAEVLEERDPKFEAMLGQMVGRITTKPGGKLEMGEPFMVQKSSRPLPKVRNTTDTGHYEDRPVAPGTLNVAQLRHIMLLYHGKEDDHDGPMGLKEIAERFQLDAAQLQRIFQSISLPPDDDTTQKRHEL